MKYVVIRGRRAGLCWGRRKENGIWLATKSRRRLMLPFCDHDSFYVAFLRLRLQLVFRDLG